MCNTVYMKNERYNWKESCGKDEYHTHTGTYKNVYITLLVPSYTYSLFCFNQFLISGQLLKWRIERNSISQLSHKNEGYSR